MQSALGGLKGGLHVGKSGKFSGVFQARVHWCTRPRRAGARAGAQPAGRRGGVERGVSFLSSYSTSDSERRSAWPRPRLSGSGPSPRRVGPANFGFAFHRAWSSLPSSCNFLEPSSSTTFTGQKSAKLRTHPHRMSTSMIRRLAVNHLESDISVEWAAALRFQLCGPRFCVIKCEARDRRERLPPIKSS